MLVHYLKWWSSGAKPHPLSRRTVEHSLIGSGLAQKGRYVCVFPVNPFHLSLVQKSASIAPVEQMVYVISWVHSIAVKDDPTEHALVKQVFAGAKHILAQCTSKKEPITAEILQALVTKFGNEKVSLADIHTLTICLLSFPLSIYRNALNKFTSARGLLIYCCVIPLCKFGC